MNEVDGQTILVGLTEEYGKVPARQYTRHIEQLQLCARNIGMILGSWPGRSLVSSRMVNKLSSGLIYLCMDDRRGVKSLISSLYAPLAEVRVSRMLAECKA